MKKAVVVGSGAGGATAAKELQGTYAVTILEAGKEFRPFSWSLRIPEKFKKTGLLFDEREIQFLFRAMKVRKAVGGMVLVTGRGLGGSTTISTGNALRMDGDLRKLGIDLDPEFEEVYREIPVSTAHERRWRPKTRQIYEAFQNQGLTPLPTPKMGSYERCAGCGRCILGCPRGVKWDSRRFLRVALDKGARLVTGAKVEKVVIKDRRAAGVVASRGWRSRFYEADLIILAAGGLGTPVILQNSGIFCEPRLFVDPVLCVAAESDGSFQDREVAMPFIIQKDHYVLSPYLDYLSFFFNRHWKYPARNILSLMIKLADTCRGRISGRKIEKTLTEEDRERLSEGVEICSEVLGRLGIRKERIFLGTINAGHPGGMLPLSQNEAHSLHPPQLPENVYVADATLLPAALGNPPILTIIALAKKVSRVCQKLC